MGLGRLEASTWTLKELIDYKKQFYQYSNVFGKDVNVEDAGTAIASNINGFLQNIAYELNIPMSQEMATSVINELNRMATESAQDGVTFLEDGKVTRAMINEAFLRKRIQSKSV